MAKLLAATSFLLVATLLHSQDEKRPVRASFNDSLGTLARAKTLAQLEDQWTHAPKDYSHLAVHAAMYSKLGGVKPDAVLTGAMPSDGEEMVAFYDSQDTKQGQDMAVTGAYHAFYSRLSIALGRDPVKLPQFLRMIHAFNFVDNVDEWPLLCGLAAKIYKVHPREYMAAVGQVEPEYKQEALECRKPPEAP
jgi:hypothetical protein